jgi:hypothetical protein
MLKALTAGTMIIAMAFMTPATASTGFVTVRQVTQSGELGQKVLREMDKPETRAKLEKMGIDANEARTRLAALSDREIRDILGANAQVQAGGDIIIGLTTILLIIIIILLIRR